MKIIKNTLLMILMALILSGCWDNQEAERMLYAHAMGIDFVDNQYKVYLQIINLSSVAKTDNPITPEELQVEIGSGTGATMEQAIFDLYKSIDEELFWGHLTYLIFSEEALKEQRVNTVIESFIRYAETRYRIWVYSTKDDMKDLLLTVPINNTPITISKLDDPLNSYDQNSFIHPINIRELIIGFNEPNHEIVIPFVSISEDWDNREGETPKPSIIGGSLLSLTTYKETLINDEIAGLQWINNNFKKSEVSFLLDKNKKDSHASIFIHDVNVKVTPILKANDITFNVNLSVIAVGNIIPSGAKLADLENGVKNTIKQEVMRTYRAGLEYNTDIYRLSEYVYRYHNKEWKKLEENGKIKLNENSLSIEVNIRKFKSGRMSLTDL
ncbi:Ger(x)C family spore germination protein [Bacillus sp. SD088]|uniref:Ger(x)C family spore germination protein n=1 Tax=Bacillus sp. SD088 TaxID=2782012 RepID=UPI001A969D35|nr:Ger(x)C family spore germination protein [Bacillus sp. SD088]MBO0993538.1 Ger(x)C family spore germination protein [Bacillus sp. SD088]